MIKKISKIGAQGDVLFLRVDQLPASAKLVEPASKYVVAHSETGHHHVATGARAHYTSNDPFIAYLAGPDPIHIDHLRDNDKHETVELYAPEIKGEVIWEVRRQGETTPDGMTRMVVD